MPRKEGTKNLTILMTDRELAVVHGLARTRKFKVTSDYVRSLIEKDAADAGVPLTFDVDRGGYRERSEETG